MWSLVKPLLLMCFQNFSPSLSNILASTGQSLAVPYFSHIRVNMCMWGCCGDLKLQMCWYLAVAVTDIDLEGGLDRGLSWFVRLLGESSLFKGLSISSKRRACHYNLCPSHCQLSWSSCEGSGCPPCEGRLRSSEAKTGMLEA